MVTPFGTPSISPSCLLCNPVRVKAATLRVARVNSAFDPMFHVNRSDPVGAVDRDVFQVRKAVRRKDGSLRVLDGGEIDKACETIIHNSFGRRIGVTRNPRLTDGSDPSW